MNTGLAKRLKKQLRVNRMDFTLIPQLKRKNRSPIPKTIGNLKAMKAQPNRRFISPVAQVHMAMVLNKMKEKQSSKRRRNIRGRGKTKMEFSKRKSPIFNTFHQRPEKKVLSNPGSSRKLKNNSGAKLKNVNIMKPSSQRKTTMLTLVKGSDQRDIGTLGTKISPTSETQLNKTNISQNKERKSNANPFANYHSFLDQKLPENRYDSRRNVSRNDSNLSNTTKNLYIMLNGRASETSDRNLEEESQRSDSKQSDRNHLQDPSPGGMKMRKFKKARMESFQLDIIKEMPPKKQSKIIIPPHALRKSGLKSPGKIIGSPNDIIQYIGPSPNPSTKKQKFTFKF
ncbi:unnamed protein product [Moneuplotes crassus]|uniref:Uncharacterized protein n=1 Tax=Euplotes crassus TaxID=5936 RepID=A0AAD1X6H1_EUPCR|nr:unnamed protein product [Moneuplotes crassus]